jgi:hypothetical protein
MQSETSERSSMCLCMNSCIIVSGAYALLQRRVRQRWCTAAILLVGVRGAIAAAAAAAAAVACALCFCCVMSQDIGLHCCVVAKLTLLR